MFINLLINGCSSQVKLTEPKLSKAELVQLNQHNVLINEIEQFVQSSLFAGMIEVRRANRLAWNSLLSIYACGSESAGQQVPILLTKMQTDFQASMQATAAQINVFVLENEQAILDDVSQTAFRLFSATYAKGYARQIALADEIQDGTKGDFCGGEINSIPNDLSAFSKKVSWQTRAEVLNLTKLSLAPHLNHGLTVFDQTIKQQGRVFEALVYSHAYQRTEQYQLLFFEVNKFDNVKRYAASVHDSAQSADIYKNLEGHNDFAYMVLSSGYHWGMMSVLAILEQDFGDLHDEKRRLSEWLIGEVVLDI